MGTLLIQRDIVGTILSFRESCSNCSHSERAVVTVLIQRERAVVTVLIQRERSVVTVLIQREICSDYSNSERDL